MKEEILIKLFPEYDISIYPENQEDQAYEDDCFIHIVREKQRIVFYNGQEEGAYGVKDIARFERLVDKRLKEAS
jgi:hypothetical protein